MATDKYQKIYSTGTQNNINVPLFQLLVNVGGTLILWLTHHLYSIVIGIYSFIVCLLVRVRNTCTVCMSSKILCESTNKITEKIRYFSKKPQHLVIILGSESLPYKDLVKLITWCFIAEISSISFYDHKNGKSGYFLGYVYMHIHYLIVIILHIILLFNYKTCSGELNDYHNYLSPNIHINYIICF